MMVKEYRFPIVKYFLPLLQSELNDFIIGCEQVPLKSSILLLSDGNFGNVQLLAKHAYNFSNYHFN